MTTRWELIITAEAEVTPGDPQPAPTTEDESEDES